MEQFQKRELIFQMKQESLAYLINLRKEREINQIDFAEKIDMKQARLAKIENLSSIPTFKTLNRYAKGLGMVVNS